MLLSAIKDPALEEKVRTSNGLLERTPPKASTKPSQNALADLRPSWPVVQGAGAVVDTEDINAGLPSQRHDPDDPHTNASSRPRPPNCELQDGLAPPAAAYIYSHIALSPASHLPLRTIALLAHNPLVHTKKKTMSSSPTTSTIRSILFTRRRCVQPTSTPSSAVPKSAYHSAPQCCHCGCRGTRTTTCPFYNPATCT
ncbi:hypothetical protein C8F01DRAFT_1141972, partial [Mycena amicta]